MWEQINFEQGTIHVRRTEFFEPKTEESQRVIDLVPEAMAVIRSYKEGSDGKFVLNGAEPNRASTYDYYRCDCTWRELHAWLREKGVRDKKAIHSLRKESGSLIASNFGIEAARQPGGVIYWSSCLFMCPHRFIFQARASAEFTGVALPNSRQTNSAKFGRYCSFGPAMTAASKSFRVRQLARLARTASAGRAGIDGESQNRNVTGMSVFCPSPLIAHLLEGNGCPGWDRTSDQVINSHLLCH